MKVTYTANDGTVFPTREECEKYEGKNADKQKYEEQIESEFKKFLNLQEECRKQGLKAMHLIEEFWKKFPDEHPEGFAYFE